MHYSPQNKGWNIEQILEHISIANYFLLILIKKGTIKALNNSLNKDFSIDLIDYDLDWIKLKAIGEHNSFHWNRPEHMEPKGKMNLLELKKHLKEQMDECMQCLIQLKNGEGVLYKTTMSVNGLGKIDVYHYIYFLVQHAQRHISQMKKVAAEFNSK